MHSAYNFKEISNHTSLTVGGLPTSKTSPFFFTLVNTQPKVNVHKKLE